MQRSVCSAQDIHQLVSTRIMELGPVQLHVFDVDVRMPVRTPPDYDGCNWMIEVTGVPLEADAEVVSIIRLARQQLNLPGG
jgi:hypothetical protein